jgi:hypothetical protein
MRKNKRLIFAVISLIAFILLFLTACFIIDAIPQDTNGKVSQSGSTGDAPNERPVNGDENTAPVAVMEIYQQNSDGYYINAGNPAYFTAESSFDADGDELEYIWDIPGIIDSGSMAFEYIFEETGKYTVTLTVSDGITDTTLKKQVEVVEIDNSIIITGEHSLTVEMQYTFTNEGPGDIQELFCLMEVPRTYLPFQVVLERRSNYRKGDQVIQDGFNVIAQFNLGGLKEGEVKTAYINCDTLLYEYEFASAEDVDDYSFGDSDVSKYTGSEYFIDSDSNIIRSAASAATQGIYSPLEKAEKLYELVTGVMEYDFSRLDLGKLGYNHASEVLQEGRGVCTDYSVLYAALCRASGIPAILVQGIPVYSILNESGRELPYGHAWVEIKLPGYGWVPIDITSEEDFMGYNYFLNLQTYKGSGIFYQSLEIDGEKFYPNGVYYTWTGGREPALSQKISYRVKGLKAEDLDVYRDSDFLDNAGLILSEYNSALNHVNNAHGQDWIFDDPGHISIEESLLQRLIELSASMEDIPASSGFASGKDELVRISREIIDAKNRQLECMRASDYNCNISNYNLFNDAVDRLFEYYNDMVDSYNEKY